MWQQRVYTVSGQTIGPCLLDVVVKRVFVVLIDVDVSVLRVVMMLLDVAIPYHTMRGVGWVWSELRGLLYIL